MADMYGGSTTLGLIATSVHPFVAGVQNELMETFLEHDADINFPGAGRQRRSVDGALANGRPEAAEFLAARGARLDLEAAAGIGRLDLVKTFFDSKGAPKPDATEAQMKYGLKWACHYGRKDVVEYLLQRGLDAGEIYRGETPLHCAAYGGDAGTLQLLLKQKPRVDIRDESYDATPLGWALHAWGASPPGPMRDRYYEVVALLIAAGAPLEPAWLDRTNKNSPAAQKIRDDPRMVAALTGRVKK
jgi:ankyrin repeat protein